MFKFTPIALALTSAIAVPAALANGAANEEINEDQSIERISVTGSRISRINTETPSPVVSIDAQSIKNTGILNVTDLLTKMPQFALGNDGSTGNYSFGNAGLNSTNLRDLGSARTLTLINGRRVVQSTTDAGKMVTDTGFIPVDLLERTDILTGGASAAYGSDAVAGVVNFVLKKDFEGTRLSGQGGTSELNDGDERSITFTTGHNFADDKANIVFSVDYLDVAYAGLEGRPWGQSRTEWIDNPLHDPTAENFETDGIPAYITGNNITWADSNIPGQMVRILVDGSSQFFDITDGNVNHMFNYADIVSDGYKLTNGAGFDPEADGKVQSPYERSNAYLLFNYDLTDSTHLSTDFRYTKVNSINSISPEFNYGSWGTSDNFAADYVPSDALAELLENDGGWYRAPFTLYEVGLRTSEVERELYAFSATLDGELDNGWYWDAYISTGKTASESRLSNRTNKLRLGRSGNNTTNDIGELCGIEDMSCPAWNSLQKMSPEVANYVRVDPYGHQIDTEQHLVSVSLSGDLMELPAGSVMFATGIEARRESIDVTVDEVWQTEDVTGSSKEPWAAARTVQEAFIELDAPIISDVYLMQEFNINVAARTSDYTYAGKNESWKVAADWVVTDDLRIRSTQSRSVRAPQLYEQFRGASIGWSGGTSDVCDQKSVNALTGDLREQVISNCQSWGIADPTTFESQVNYDNGVNAKTLGNAQLKVEKADTFTLGFAYQPEFLTDFAMTVDYYNIEIKDSIENLSSTAILKECAYSADIASNPFCSLIQRDTTGNVELVTKWPANIGKYIRRGVDIETSYAYSLGDSGDINLKLYATKIIESGKQSTTNEDYNNYQGVYGSPEWKGRFVVNYGLNDFNANWSVDHTMASLVERTATLEMYDQPELPSSTVHNARVSFNLTEDANLYAGVKNAFDKKWSGHPTASNGSGAYSLMGRYYYAGFSYNF